MGSSGHQLPCLPWWDHLPPPAQKTPSILFAAEVTTITLVLDYCRLTEPVQHNIVVYSDKKSYLQAIEGEDTESPFICYIVNFPLVTEGYRHTCPFCWIPSYCGIEGHEGVDQLAKETIGHGIHPLPSVHYSDLMVRVNLRIKQVEWFKSNGMCLYMVKIFVSSNQLLSHGRHPDQNWVTLVLSWNCVSNKFCGYPDFYESFQMWLGCCVCTRTRTRTCTYTRGCNWHARTQCNNYLKSN